MDNFKNWILLESIQISNNIKGFPLIVKSNHEVIEYADRDKLKYFIKDILMKYFTDDYKNIDQRYDVILTNIRDSYEVIFEFELKPKGFRQPELSQPEDFLYDFNIKHRDGKTGSYIHKTPKDAIAEIPKDPDLVYRGMSWEEWSFIKKNGFIQSKGSYNFDSQNNLTFYGSAETAEYYANSFAPNPFKTSLKKPSVVISISRRNVKGHEDFPDKIPSNEFAHIGKLDIKEIKGAWMLSPVKSKSGKFEIILTYINDGNNSFRLGKPREGSRSNPSIGYAIRKLI